MPGHGGNALCCRLRLQKSTGGAMVTLKLPEGRGVPRECGLGPSPEAAQASLNLIFADFLCGLGVRLFRIRKQ